jgi:hypothetical protein
MAGLVAGCGADASHDAGAQAGEGAGSSASPSKAPPATTPGLDAVAVIGHSGATGLDSDPDHPGTNAYANSWATGDNPAVRSIYQRLLATHPALEGHSYNEAQNGSDVNALPDQADRVMAQDPVPDVVFIQSLDNDIRCDGTDRQNLAPFATRLGMVIRRIVDTSPTTQVYLVSQWASVETYTSTIEKDPTAVAASSGTGLCDVFGPGARRRPAAMRRLQAIVDLYWATMERTCARVPRCLTDGGAMQAMVPRLADLTGDFNHLSVSGQRKYAALAWATLPAAIRDRP